MKPIAFNVDFDHISKNVIVTIKILSVVCHYLPRGNDQIKSDVYVLGGFESRSFQIAAT